MFILVFPMFARRPVRIPVRIYGPYPKIMSASIDLYHDTRRARKDGTYPVRLKITYKNTKKYYPLTSVSIEDFEKARKAKPREAPIRELKAFLELKTDWAEEVLKTMGVFDFEEFERRYYREDKVVRTVATLFDEKIIKLKVEGQVSSYQSYQTTWNNIAQYHKAKRPLNFEDITPDWLTGFHRFLAEDRVVVNNEGKEVARKGIGATSVGIYMRTLRAVYNLAIEEGLVSREGYPFGKRRYQIPGSRNIKKALTKEDIRALRKYNAIDPREAKARDLWVFSYLANGMNIKDICNLRFGDVDKKLIMFKRAKTARAKQVEEFIRVGVLPPMTEIIERWGNKPTGDPKQRIFPFLPQNVTPEQERDQVQLLTQRINKYIRKVAEALQIEKDVTTYTARHSYATVLDRENVPFSYIQESMGHSRNTITHRYMDFTDEEKILKYARKLL